MPKNGYKQLDETIRKRIETRRQNGWFKNIEETKRKQSEASIKRWQNPEYLRKQSERMKEQWKNSEWRQKHIKSQTGKHWKLSDETKRKMSERMKKQWKDPEFRKKQMTRSGTKKNHGRIYLYNPNHPLATYDGYVRRYRLVAEKCLNRYLTRQEVIHHIDKNPLNDKPENLYLFPNNGEHTVYHYLKNKPELKSNILN